ncbi:pseudouridine synthase [Desulfotomaculum sp. 1211_IL3151]|uniref:pseudouridine synthase n=1 Tax=Desulfotomaculum sp. 1211_IL3151 TaxID=3084055 RepID=UPI002FD96189
MMERLQKILAQAGVASRRHSEELIINGQVKVNGTVVTELGTRVDPMRDKIEVKGRPIPPPEKKVYLLMNKPRGYVTTLRDDRGRKTIADLLEGVSQRVYPVGRLDYDSEGLLLLTNDGELTQAISHPKHKVKKTYLVKVAGVPETEQLKEMAQGLVLEDGPTAPAGVRLAGVGDNRALLEIIIHEGRNRQVRRMCEHIGYKVLRLRRTGIGNLELGNLKSGEVRELTKKELRELALLVGVKINYSDTLKTDGVKKKGPIHKGKFNATRDKVTGEGSTIARKSKPGGKFNSIKAKGSDERTTKPRRAGTSGYQEKGTPRGNRKNHGRKIGGK